MLHRHAETFLTQVRSFQDSLTGSLDDIFVSLGHLLDCEATCNHKFSTGDNDLLVDVLDESLHEGCANFLDSLLEPDIIMQELAFTRQNSQIDGEIEVIAVNNLDETVFDLLSDVKDPAEVHNPLLVSAALTDASNHQVLVELPEFLEDGA